MSTPPPLTLVLPGALPPGPIAAELARALGERAPTLQGWFGDAAAATRAFDAEAERCTATESWFIERAGFVPPQPGAGRGSALAALQVLPAAAPGEPVWVAEPVHIAVGRDGLVMTAPDSLSLSPDEAARLAADARPLFDAAGFALGEGEAPWRVRVPTGVRPYAATPAAVAGTPLDRWWPRGDDARPWRRLFNEIQMAWHGHPVNAAREAQGKAPVNGLWLHGGAPDWAPDWGGARPDGLVGRTPWLKALAARSALPWSASGAWRGSALVLEEALDEHHRAERWGDWLDALRRLEAERFAPLAAAMRSGAVADVDLVLPDLHRIVTLGLRRRSPLLRWLPRPQRDWTAWWLPLES